DTSDFCRELGAARVTSCKSGKDRTAMSVTMEQTRICEKEVHAVNPKLLCHNMRLYGVRGKNVFMNIGAWSLHLMKCNVNCFRIAINHLLDRINPDVNDISEVDYFYVNIICNQGQLAKQ
ncbi:unnamed protein product, partial [Albugo candida]